MSRLFFGLTLISAVSLSSSPLVWAATMPAILGKVSVSGSQSAISQVGLSLYLDDGDGVLDESDVLAGSTLTDDDGNYEFNALDPDAAYFVVAGGVVSELQVPLKEPLLIDSFDITQSVTANPVSGSRMSSVTGPSNLILGGVRDMYLEVLSGIAEAKLRANPYSISSDLQIDLAAGVTGMAVVTWDGVAGTVGMHPDAGLGGMDLTHGGDYDGIMFRLAVDKAGAGQALQLVLYSGEASSTAEFAFPVVSDVVPSGFAFVPFAEFVGGADARNVTAIQLVVDASYPSLDARVDLLGLTGPANVDFQFLPEPSSTVLLLFGLLGWIGFRREGRLIG